MAKRFFNVLRNMFNSKRQKEFKVVNMPVEEKKDSLNEIYVDELSQAIEEMKPKQRLEIKGLDSEFLYDGTEKVVSGIELSVQLNGHTYSIEGVEAEIRGTDAGIYEGSVSGVLCVINELGVDVTNKFDICISMGKLIIRKRKIVVVSGSAKKFFDGMPLIEKNIKVEGDGLANGDKIQFDITGKQVLVGENINKFTYSFIPEDISRNYDVETNFGILDVIDREDKYEIEMISKSAEFLFDGHEKVVEGFEQQQFIINGNKYKVKGLYARVALTEEGSITNDITGKAIVYDLYGNVVSRQFNVRQRAGTLRILHNDSLNQVKLSSALYEEDNESNITNNTVDKSKVMNVQSVLLNDKFVETNMVSVVSNKEVVDELPDIQYILGDMDLKSQLFSKLYGLNADFFADQPIIKLEFSTRIANRIKEPLNIRTVGELLNLSYEKLFKVKGFGKTSFIEVDEKLRKLKTIAIDIQSTKDENAIPLLIERQNIFKEHMLEVCEGDFSFCDELDLDENDIKISNLLKEACACVDKDLLIQACTDKTHLLPIMEMLSEEAEKYNKHLYAKRLIYDAYKFIPIERRNCKVEGFIYAYTYEDTKKKFLFNVLKESQAITFIDLVKSNIIFNENYVSSIADFFKWCSFDLSEEVDKFFDNLYKKDREKFILNLRAEGNTLETIGKQLNITRERVRQIENKVRRRFSILLYRYRLILKIYAIRNQDEVLTPVELIEYFKENTDVMLYLLRGTNTLSYTYDRELDVFIVGNVDLAERTQQYVDSLPDTFSVTKIEEFINSGIEEYNLGEEILRKAIENAYNLTGKVYHRSRLTLTAIYEQILKKYYPNGIWVYGKYEIEEFRNHIFEDYGDIALPQKDRALVARVCDISILCDRGTYKPKQDTYISKQLAQDICDYIEKSEQPIFMTNTLFSVFEKQLIAEGVENKYYLQGILHEIFGDRWIFRRDYISKDDRFTSVYSEIVNFIKKSTYPVKKQEIFEAFPGITEIVLNLATSDSDILNLFGEYIHSCHLKLSDGDIKYLHGTVEIYLTDKDVCHCKEIYGYINYDNPTLLSNNYVMNAFSLYSLLECLFATKYNFSRPFISRENAEIKRGNDILYEMVRGCDKIEIYEIQDFAKTYHFQLNSILDFIDSCNDTHILANNSTVISIEVAGLNEAIVNIIEKEILGEIRGTIPITQLQCIHKFPKIPIQWNEWLIYSVIKKWGTSLEVAASANQFRQSVPLVSKKGQMNRESFENISVEEAGSISVVDDLTNIDDLIGKYLMEDLGGLDEL